MLARTVPGLLPPLDDAAALAVTIVASAAGEGPISGASPPAAVPGPASHDLVRGDGRRRAADVARRGEPRRPRRPVPRRVAGVRPRRPRGAPSAARGRARGDRAGRPGDDVPGPLPVHRGDEPVPVRVRRRRTTATADAPSATVERYDRRVSGPLRDRIDLWVTMPRLPAASIMGGPEPETSEVVGARIATARTVARARGTTSWSMNGRLTGAALRSACAMDAAARRRAIRLAELESASGRSTERILRVARTIADLAGDEAVREHHLDEAVFYRSTDARLSELRAG